MCSTEFDTVSHAADWMNYGGNDMSRCHQIRNRTVSVLPDFKKITVKYPMSFIKQVDALFGEMCNGNVIKSKTRKAYICACIYHLQIEQGNTVAMEEIYHPFGISKKDMSNGMSVYEQAFPENIVEVGGCDLIESYCRKLNIDQTHIGKIKTFANLLEGSSRSIKDIEPQSFATGIIYFYLCIKRNYSKSKNITLSTFCNIIGRSENTITKVVTEISNQTGNTINHLK